MGLQEKVAARVEELAASPITLAKSVGLERGYINDIIIGRKKTIRADKAPLVAMALQVPVEWLSDAEPADSGSTEAHREPHWGGVCEMGVWRSEAARMLESKPPRGSVLEACASADFVFQVRGRGMEGAGVQDGMMAFATRVEGAQGAPRTGSIVVLERRRIKTGETEVSLRRVLGPTGRLLASEPPEGHGAVDLVDLEEPKSGEVARVVGVVAVVALVLP